ncbi:dihydrofolate reductase family protein [Streptomyces sp. NRRL B-3229]|uniref:dihydrofolate reductase family protein n=1 Tax=Streptomyces sp. NRRL B-3229 TaxID=1463836 RepID=UPI00068CD323|nr:dihydrofolate reductase family protein [Streptomyces sp. NRRL B-3229]
MPSADDRWSFQVDLTSAEMLREVLVGTGALVWGRRQALDLGLVDEVCISVVPVLLGNGVPCFADLTNAPHRFDDPTVLQCKGATHLWYRVRR